jgi:hypothetical protein
VARIQVETSYPGIHFLTRTRSWYWRLRGFPPECEHLEGDPHWMALLQPDVVYLRGKCAKRRDPVRPEASLCRDCLLHVLSNEIATHEGKVVAFEPDPANFSQYFYVAAEDNEAAGVTPELAAVLDHRLKTLPAACHRCSAAAAWLWFTRDEIVSLEETEKIQAAVGEALCPNHAAQQMRAMLERIAAANIFFINLPYGAAGAYLWF